MENIVVGLILFLCLGQRWRRSLLDMICIIVEAVVPGVCDTVSC